VTVFRGEGTLYTALKIARPVMASPTTTASTNDAGFALPQRPMRPARLTAAYRTARDRDPYCASQQKNGRYSGNGPRGRIHLDARTHTISATVRTMTVRIDRKSVV